MSATSVRCYRCGKRIPQEVRVCPACGADQPLHVSRIRCHYCGRRVPANVVRCPSCNHNPRRFYLRPRHLFWFATLLVLVFAVYAVISAPVWFRSLALATKPTATAAATVAPTRTPVLIFVTATSTTSPTSVPIDTETPVPSPTTEAVATQPLQTPVPTATFTPRPAVPRPTFTPTTTRPVLSSPVLVDPLDGQKVSGPRRRMVLSFHGTIPLGERDWFRVQVDFKDRNNQPWTWCGWSRSNTIILPAAYYDESWQLDRTFRWHVNIAQPVDASPSTCAAVVTTMSAPSPEWTFYWY